MLNGVEFTSASEVNNTPGGTSGQLLGVDAVREFSVVKDTYGAEYGKRPGAQVNIVTASGTNQLHGNAYEFLRNSALDARNPFDSGDNSAFRAQRLRRLARRADQEGQNISFRQLRRLPPGPGTERRHAGAGCDAARTGARADTPSALSRPVRAMLTPLKRWPGSGVASLLNCGPSRTAWTSAGD